MTINWQWQLNLCNGSLQLCAESLSNLNTVSLHVNTTDYTNVNILFLFFFPSLILFFTLCLTSSLSFSLSLSHLCASDLHFLLVSELCAIPVFSLLHSYSKAVCQGDGLPGGESVHQWLCADKERLESQALPSKLQKGTGPLH